MFYKWVLSFGNLEKKVAPQIWVIGFDAHENAKMDFWAVFGGHA